MGKIAFVFPGQGAQRSGMGRELFEASDAAKLVFDMAEDIRPGTMEQCFEGPQAELSVTLNAQPCLFAVDLAAAAALAEAGITADGAAGFSLGEIAAASFCGMLTYEEGFSLVCKRAELMNACAEKNKGAMAAVLRLDGTLIEELCKKAGRVYPVNYNCSSQLVCAGDQSDIKELARLVSENGGKAIPLAVSGAFHSPFMEEAAAGFESELAKYDINPPRVPLYSNVTARPYGVSPSGADSARLMADQIKSPVLWQKTIENMISDGFDTFVEVGPGKTLCGLIKKISGSVNIYNVEDGGSLDAAINALSGGRNA